MSDFRRALIHFPVGLLFGAIMLLVSSTAGMILSLGFLVYEVIEDWRIEDRSYKDVLGFLFGLAALPVVFLILRFI